MDFNLLPSVSLRPRSFNALVAPNEIFASALNRNLNLKRFKVLYICGNSSSVLSRLDRRFQNLEICQGFTVFQLITILEEARHSLIVIEHDPLLYEDAQWMVEYVSQGLHDAAKEAAVLLYSPGTDTYLEDMTRNADRVFYFDEGGESYDEAYFESLSKHQLIQNRLPSLLLNLKVRRVASTCL